VTDDMPWLEDFAGDTLDGFGSYDGIAFADLQFDDARADNSKFLECRLSHVAFERGNLARSSFVDSLLTDVRLVSTSFAESQWRGTTVRTSLGAGVDLSGSTLRRVTFTECKLESPNLRGATLHEVVFERCTLNHLDLTDATLTGCSFRGCTLHELDLTKATLSKTDLRTSELDIRHGHLSLAGATIDIGQLLALAPGLAQELKINVKS
jgi:uncharacterized protein YjbI with pentapeptide repeats